MMRPVRNFREPSAICTKLRRSLELSSRMKSTRRCFLSCLRGHVLPFAPSRYLRSVVNFLRTRDANLDLVGFVSGIILHLVDLLLVLIELDDHISSARSLDDNFSTKE